MADILTGVRARFSLNGVKVGYATGVTLRENITYEPIKVLDSIEVTEHCPVDYDVSMTADMIRITGDSIKKAGWFPLHGQSPAEFLTNILNTGELTADLEDTVANQIIGHVEGVKIASHSITISSRGVVGQNVEMVARRARDEADLI